MIDEMKILLRSLSYLAIVRLQSKLHVAIVVSNANEVGVGINTQNSCEVNV